MGLQGLDGRSEVVSDGERRGRIGGVHKVFVRSGRDKAPVEVENRISRPLQGKKWYRMCDDESCVLCNICGVEDVEQLLETIGRWKEHKSG